MQNNTNAVMASDSRMAALRQKVEVEPQQFENWKPAEGELLIGEIVGGDVFHHALYGEQKVMKVRTDDHRNLCVFLNGWLMKALALRDAVTGDAIALRFLGKKTGVTGNSYNAYSLDVMK
jgi:hypothetical protein